MEGSEKSLLLSERRLKRGQHKKNRECYFSPGKKRGGEELGNVPTILVLFRKTELKVSIKISRTIE